MSVSFWFEDYLSPEFEYSLNNVNASRVLKLAHIDHDPSDPYGKLSPDDIFNIVYNLECYILDHRDDPNLWLYVKYLRMFSKLEGCARSNGLTATYG